MSRPFTGTEPMPIPNMGTPWHINVTKIRSSGSIKKRKAKQFARLHGRRMNRGR